MAEIEITLPTVQYGNVKVRMGPEEMGLSDISDSHALGMTAAVYLNLFTQGFRVGAQMDVSAHQGVVQSDEVSQAQEVLNEGLGGVTEVSDHVHHFEYGDDNGSYCECGAEEPGISPPWDKKPPAASKKPWETGTNTPDKLVAGLGDGW